MPHARTTTDGPRSVLDLKRPPTLPGDMLLEEFLRPAHLTQVDAARRMKMPLSRLNEIVNGKRGISADTALRLARLFKMSPEFWMGRAPSGRGAECECEVATVTRSHRLSPVAQAARTSWGTCLLRIF
ncbi:MAG: HigA family addiction module antitoxin [Gemmatimonadetes bacterium]|nr:HigA family addiction module antitoxin [Gemmatimonadota bacterium]